MQNLFVTHGSMYRKGIESIYFFVLVCALISGKIVNTESEIVCPRLDIRELATLEQMVHCDVIEGDLLIAFLRIPYNLTFHHLYEITGSLLLYDVDGLASLSTLFPMLILVRGQSLIYNYAFVIRATEFQDITLPSLRLIERGGIRIENNRKLCHSNLIQWKQLFGDPKATPFTHPVDVTSNGDSGCPTSCPLQCPRNPNGHRQCWSETVCQSFCSSNCTDQGLACHMFDTDQCCHPQCKGGCYANGADSCVACRHVRHSGLCILQCPTGTLEYRQRRCVTAEHCLLGSSKLLSGSYVTVANRPENQSVFVTKANSYAIYQGSCVTQCPSDHMKDAKTGYCVPCEHQCPKKSCPELLIHDLRDLDAVVGCHSAVAIYLSIQDGEPEFVNHLLEEAFARLRTIEQSLRIVRSPALTTLRMLHALESLGTSSGNASHSILLEISGNDNLRELWLPKITSTNRHGLVVRGAGSVRITQNRRLCPDQIIKLFQSDAIHVVRPGSGLSETEQDLIRLTNGDLAYCNWATISMNVSEVRSSTIQVSWFKPHADYSTSEEALLTFLLYRQFPKGKNVTQEPGLFALNEWDVLPVTCANPVSSSMSICTIQLGNLIPATYYALFVEVRNPLRRTGALSELVYFTTQSINPTVPRYTWLQAVDSSTLKLTWIAPKDPGGLIDSYLIWVRPFSWDPVDHLHANSSLPNSDETLVREQDRSGPVNLPCWDTKSGMNLELRRCPNCSHCPPLYELETLYSFQNYPNRYATWPATVSGWTVDNQGHALPVTFLNYSRSGSPRASIRPDHVGLIVHRVWNGDFGTRVNDREFNLEKKEYTQLLHSLPHFTPVIIELQACQNASSIHQPNGLCNTQPPWSELHVDGQSVTLNLSTRNAWSRCEAQLCSPRVSIMGRTKARAQADTVPARSITYASLGPGSIQVLWPSPAYPNGRILYYQLRYRLIPLSQVHLSFAPVDSNRTENYNQSVKVMLVNTSTSDTSPTWLTKYVSISHWMMNSAPKSNESIAIAPVDHPNEVHDEYSTTDTRGGVILTDLTQGVYTMQLRAISLAGTSPWTKAVTFVALTSDSGLHDQFGFGQQVWIFLLGAFLTLILLIVTFIIFFCHARRRYLRLTAWTSTNPDYWTIYEVDNWEMDRADIDLLGWNHPLGHGSFGTVYRGVVHRLRTPSRAFYTDPTNISVAIKTINTATTLFDRRDFISEACHMKQFQTYHLVRLLGLVSRSVPEDPLNPMHRRFRTFCTSLRSGISQYRRTKSLLDDSTPPNNHINHPPGARGESAAPYHPALCASMFEVAPDSPLVVMELMSEGDLASYLRHMGDHGLGSVEPSQAYLWATQIADGMAYLAAKHYVHRDLAARNCLINAKLIVKIGDFGLCRQVYDRNYYQKRGHGRLPIRWMSPESLESAYFTSQSDVWSFGVVLWEVATMASLPYRGLSHDDVIQFVLGGNTLLSGGAPTGCPELLQNLMIYCWAFDPHKRPTFLDLCVLLAPRFGDTTFRAASFFYIGEPVVDPKLQIEPINPPVLTLQLMDNRQAVSCLSELIQGNEQISCGSDVNLHETTKSEQDDDDSKPETDKDCSRVAAVDCHTTHASIAHYNS